MVIFHSYVSLPEGIMKRAFIYHHSSFIDHQNIIMTGILYIYILIIAIAIHFINSNSK